MKRSFCLGSEWLYYKLYTGAKSADIVLSEKLAPIIAELEANNTIEQWFFIRYNDPDNHLRIRFKCETPKKTSIVIAALYPILNELLENDIIWKVQTDTYQRELERYGEATMLESETIFCADSKMILDYISLKPYFENEETQLHFSFLAIDQFLTAFDMDSAAKLQLMDGLQQAFKNEFDADKNLRKQFDKHYRSLLHDIAFFLSGNAKNDFGAIYLLIQEKQEKIVTLAPSIKQKLEIELDSFLASHIHMMVNRQYTSKQRYYECLIYDHLHRYYKMNHFKEMNLKNENSIESISKALL